MGPDRGIGWELAPDQSGVFHDRYRVCSCTLYIGFWNDVHVDIEKLRAEGSGSGPVLKIMPHPTKPPHKHAFMQYSSRRIAEGAREAMRKRLDRLQFVQKVGWGRPPKLIKESFKFDSGMGEILKADATHIMPPKHGQQHAARPPPHYGTMNAPNHAMSASTAQAPAAAANSGPLMNMERARMISNSQPQYAGYSQLQGVQYMQYPSGAPVYGASSAQQVQRGQQPPNAAPGHHQYPQYR